MRKLINPKMMIEMVTTIIRSSRCKLEYIQRDNTSVYTVSKLVVKNGVESWSKCYNSCNELDAVKDFIAIEKSIDDDPAKLPVKELIYDGHKLRSICDDAESLPMIINSMLKQAEEEGKAIYLYISISLLDNAYVLNVDGLIMKISELLHDRKISVNMLNDVNENSLKGLAEVKLANPKDKD